MIIILSLHELQVMMLFYVEVWNHMTLSYELKQSRLMHGKCLNNLTTIMGKNKSLFYFKITRLKGGTGWECTNAETRFCAMLRSQDNETMSRIIFLHAQIISGMK